jgi:release factor glutamine methyltransferase
MRPKNLPNSSNKRDSEIKGQRPGIRLSEFLAYATTTLQTAGIDNPQLDSRLLAAHGLKLDRAQLLSQSDRVLTEREIGLLTVFIEYRARHESVARIKGEREFWSLPFGLNEATLEPRPDSETLIEAALKKTPKPEARILDIGTGTGCLLLSLLHELPKATGLGVDISERAIQQAQENAQRLNMQNRATFKSNNWAEGITETFDIIISNPPYIAHDVILTLAPEVRDFDPTLALNGGKDGLNAYRHLIPELPKLLKPKGFAVFEIGYDQATSVTTLFKNAGFTTITTRKDLGGNDRCLLASMD